MTTKYGLTRKIAIKDSIRQGGVLSVLEYGLLMDESSKEIAKEDLGIKIEGIDQAIGCLLWVDDVILADTDEKRFQRMLDITDRTANKYHIEYGPPKSNVMSISRKGNKPKFMLGNMELKHTDNYKYLGFIQNSNNNMKDHLQILKGKVEAVYQRILALAGNTTFKNIEMESIWINVQMKMEPILTYSGEIWDLNKGQTKELNGIMDKIIKRILKVPPGTPREALYIETGLLDPETIIKKNRVNMELRIQMKGSDLIKRVVNSNQKNGWKQKTKEIKDEMGITEEDTTGGKEATKNKIKKKALKFFKEKLTRRGRDKSKIQYLIQGRGDWKPGHRSEYMSKLTRNQVSMIFQGQTRMLKVKMNYKKGQKDLSCRICKKTEETQHHILEECEDLHQEETTKVTKLDLFNEGIQHLREVAKRIQTIMNKLEQTEA